MDHYKEYIKRFKDQRKLDNIYLEGFVKNEDLPKYYSFCNLFMLLSIYDTNPLVIFEALASGIPILCSNRAANSVDFIIDGKNGYIVDPYNIDEVVSKL